MGWWALREAPGGWLGRRLSLVVGIALSPTWLRGQAWRRADSRVEELFSLPAYADMARGAEAAGLDFLFGPDVTYLHPAGLGTAPGFSTLDSLTLAAALAGLTNSIGLVPTVQTSFAQPYTAARQIMSLHQLSGGRAGWNVVTALGGAHNFGMKSLPESSERYARAAEFVAVVRALWDSYPAEALVFDRAGGTFADVARVQALDSLGGQGDRQAPAFFDVAGPLSVAAHPSGRPPLFQAGGSPAAVAFAGAVADAVFAVAADEESARAQRSAVRAAAQEAGRQPGAVRFLPGLNLVLAGTEAAARDLVGAPTGGGAQHWSVIGTPAAAADAIERRYAARAIDGFIALPTGGWPSIQAFYEELMPLLVERGLFKPGSYGDGLWR